MFKTTEFLNQIPKYKKPILVILVAVLISGTGFYFWIEKPWERFRPPAYTQVYRLTNDKISQSAAIVLFLPNFVDKAFAQENVKFYPQIDGEWLESEKKDEIVFKPKEKLKLNRYFLAELMTSGGAIIRSDFLIVDNPKIIAIFPKEGSETNEKSEITVVFNRPMVPLTTLGYLEEKQVPVEISPATEGRFKWITTRNLQFIPKERLQRSSRYTVKIKSGLVSMDGLEVEAQERSFITRPLRYVYLTEKEAIYNQPINISFNQPVDLERTKNEITLIDNKTGQDIPFIAEYGPAPGKKEPILKYDDVERDEFGFKGLPKFLAGIATKLGFGSVQDKKPEPNGLNASLIQVYNATDQFGRSKLWNPEGSYALKIKRAYPAEGDIALEEGREIYFWTTDIIKDITAESARTSYAEADFFDPQGKIWISFYEDIDLSKSEIIIPKSIEMNYGEKCKEEEEFASSVACEKVPDYKKIYVTFKAEEVGLGERLEINFQKVVNKDGVTINVQSLLRYITSYPQFKISRTSPANNSYSGSVAELVFCSNTPILLLSKEEWSKRFRANLDYELEYWYNSRQVTSSWREEACTVGEFHTTIKYGLIPLSNYQLEFDLEDVFSQKLTYGLSFTTGAMPSEYLSFYRLQASYNVTTPQKTKLTYAVKNMEYVNLEICKLAPADFLYYLRNRPGSNKTSSEFSSKCQKIVNDTINLPQRYWLKNYFKIDLKDYFTESFGHYILTLSHPAYLNEWREWSPIYERTFITVTNLAVAEKKIEAISSGYGAEEALTSQQLSELHNLYWVTRISDLEPVSGAEIDIYRGIYSQNKLSLNSAGTYTTNQDGIVLATPIYDSAGVIIIKDEDSTVIPRYESELAYASDALSDNKIYLYTDKPIYRPTQEVFIKGIYRVGYDGDYEISRGRKINLKIRNSKNDVISSQDLEVSDFGTFNTKIILDSNAPLGTYGICAEYSCTYFNVLEYVPAPFEVKVSSDKDEYISKDTANLEVEANYYFGVPLEGGEVEYAISSQNYYFDRYSQGSFHFDSDWYYWGPDFYGEKFILRGKTPLDSAGEARISQVLDLEKLFKDPGDRKSKIIVFDITVKNPQGQSVSAQKSFILHAGDFYLNVVPDRNFFGKGEQTNVRIKTVDTQGQEMRVDGINLKLFKIKWIYNKRLGSDGGYYYQWEEQKNFVSEYNFNTDGKGNYALDVKISEEGTYLLESEAKDSRGNTIRSDAYLYVWGPAEVSVRPTTGTELEIEAEKTALGVGETGKVIIKSPYARAKALISIERGRVFEYYIKELEGNLHSFSFTAKEEYIPNVYLSVLLQSSQPEIKFGSKEFIIDTNRRELDIEVQSSKKYYLPGEEVTLDILSRDWQGQPVEAELSIAVVDLSVLALQGNPKKNPLVFFYGGFPLTVSTASNIRNVLIEFEIPTKGGGGGDEGAAEEAALAKKMRGEFKETAFWQAEVRTDGSGKAQIRFILPDNLTTWQIEAVGLTQDTKLGTDYQEFMTRKELMAIPLKPRFVVPGDSFYIGAKIFNQSAKKRKIIVEFDSQTLVLLGDDAKTEITIESDETNTVYFKVKAPDSIEKGVHAFVLSAKSADLEDTVSQTIDITRNDTYEATATANYTKDAAAREYVFLPDNIVKDKGELIIKDSATLAVFLSDSLNYLLRYPYGCAEQTASRLNVLAIVKKGLNLPNIADKFKLEKIEFEGKEYSIDDLVQIGLTKLYNIQNWDGGFSFWKYGISDFYITRTVVEAFNNLSLAGYQVNDNSHKRAVEYLYDQIATNLYASNDVSNDAVILIAYTIFRSPNFVQNGVSKQWIINRIINIVNDDLFINERISNQSLAYLAILMAREEFPAHLTDKIRTVLDNRIDIDARGAFLESNQNFSWHSYETAVQNTALYLKALAVEKSSNPVLDKVVRWLLNSRYKDGAWGSTQNTLAVVDAFTDFLGWKRETESEFQLKVLVNQKPVDSFDFNPETILEQRQNTLPLSDLKFNENNLVLFQKKDYADKENPFYYDLSLKYFLPADQIPPRDEGFSITRGIYKIEDDENKNPLKEARVGEVLKIHLEITVPAVRNFVIVEDFIPAGMEIVNLELATEQHSLLLSEEKTGQDYEYYYWRYRDRNLNPEYEELYDDRAFLYKENLSPGVYEYDYYVRALTKGQFTHLPTTVSEMYFPENFGRTAAGYFEVK